MAAEPRLNGKAATAALFLGTAVFVVAADLLTKWLAFPAGYWRLPPFIMTIIPNFCDLSRSENRGGVFGVGQGRVAFFILFTLAASAAIVWAAARYARTSRFLTFGLGCVFGGAMGNLWDRVHFHYVRDFIHCFVGRYQWPTFNVADSAICVGVAVLVLHSFLTPDARRESSRPKRI